MMLPFEVSAKPVITPTVICHETPVAHLPEAAPPRGETGGPARDHQQSQPPAGSNKIS